MTRQSAQRYRFEHLNCSALHRTVSSERRLIGLFNVGGKRP
ncbi:hypothetical protein [Pseudomonas sp. BBP2017]|nr:hypothetical protein [Pseudomonas sp. BBP2017]